jgi:hypothetical protein
MTIMKKLVPPLFFFGLMSGCSTTGPTYSWYHPFGGEYLFAFDHNECVSELADMGMMPGTDIDGPFFKCMQNRGYSLVEPSPPPPEYENLGKIQ